MPVTELEAVAALPPHGWVRRYVVHAIKQTTSPLVYHLGMGLTVMAATCPLAYGMHYAGALRANNFCLLVGRSGEDNKSSALNVGREILDAAASTLIGEYPGSPEGLIESLAVTPSQMVPISEFGRFLSAAQGGYYEPMKTLLADCWDCLTEDTDILTPQGWVNIKDIQAGETIWALNPENDELVESKVYEARGRAVNPGERLVQLKSSLYDVLTTEGHNFYIKYRDPALNFAPSAKYLVKKGAEMVGRKSSYFLPLAAISTQTFSGSRISPELLAEHLRFSGELLPDAAELTVEQFLTFWEKAKNPNRSYFSTTDRKLIDRLQQLAVERGLFTQYSLYTRRTHSYYKLWIRSRRFACTDPGHKRSARFTFVAPEAGQMVYCATTEYGTLITRRNGKVVILGNCGAIQRVRANNRITRVDNPRLSIAAACSIPYLEKHTLAEDWTGGFMGRWMVLYGQRERIDPDPIGDRTDFDWLAEQLRIRATMPSAGWCMRLTPAGKALWNDWFYDVSNRVLPGNIIGIRARAPTIARKIALIYGWDFGPAMQGQPWEMDVDILEPAIKLTELHIRSLVDLSSMIAEHHDARMRRSVLQAIESYGGVANLGEILSIMKTKKRTVTEILDALIEEKKISITSTSIGQAYALV